MPRESRARGGGDVGTGHPWPFVAHSLRSRFAFLALHASPHHRGHGSLSALVLALCGLSLFPSLALSSYARADEVPEIDNVPTFPEVPLPESSPLPDKERVGTKWGGTPIGNYTTDKGFSFGALAQRFGYGDGTKKPFDDLFSFFGQFETLGAREIALGYEKTGIGSEDLRFLTQIDFSYNPFQRYYGVGAFSFRSPALEASGYNYYLQNFVELDNSLRKTVTSHLDVYVGMSLVSNRSQANQPDSQYERDFGGEPTDIRYAKFQLGAVLERRDSEFIPSEGDYAAALVTLAPSLLSNGQSGWERLDVEYRRYFPLVKSRWLYFASQVRYAVASSGTPLIELPRLGSLSTLRGYPYNRYLDSNSATLRGELRSVFIRTHFFGLPLKGGVGFFADTGRVGDSLSQLASNPTRVAGGFTIFGSYFTDDFLGSADVGFSQDGNNLYLHLEHAF